MAHARRLRASGRLRDAESAVDLAVLEAELAGTRRLLARLSGSRDGRLRLLETWPSG